MHLTRPLGASAVAALLALFVVCGPSSSVPAETPAGLDAAVFDNLNKRAFALGEINGYLSFCGQSDPLRHRATILDEASAAGASKDQVEALTYAFNKGLSAGATAAPLQFTTCTKAFYDYLRQKNEALSQMERQQAQKLPNK